MEWVDVQRGAGLEMRMDEPTTGTDRKRAAEAAEAAAIRRRWINLGEVVAVLAVVISAATLWLNWSEHSGSQAEKAAESSRATMRAATLTLTAEPASKGARLDLKPATGEQVIEDQTIHFPTSLGIDPVQTTGESRIEARWFDSALKQARDKAGLPGDSRGDERLPVLIETRFLADGEEHRDSALYDVGYAIKGGGFLSGHELTLRGLSLVLRTRSASPAVLDARWSRLTGKKRG
jgi:hypothetical protein